MDLVDSQKDYLNGGSALSQGRYLHTGADRHVCLEWDSNPRSHASDRAATVARHFDNINASEFVEHAAALSCTGRREASVLVLAPLFSPGGAATCY
jgi:hypothetical protein